MKKIFFALTLLLALNLAAKDKRPNILFVFSSVTTTLRTPLARTTVGLRR